jgi:hypothetical protein
MNDDDSGKLVELVLFSWVFGYIIGMAMYLKVLMYLW